jgi:hypothetical protein
MAAVRFAPEQFALAQSVKSRLDKPPHDYLNAACALNALAVSSMSALEISAPWSQDEAVVAQVVVAVSAGDVEGDAVKELFQAGRPTEPPRYPCRRQPSFALFLGNYTYLWPRWTRRSDYSMSWRVLRVGLRTCCNDAVLLLSCICSPDSTSPGLRLSRPDFG